MASEGITHKDILLAIKDDALRAFVRKEMKRNKQFTIRLAAQVIDSVELDPTINKYQALLELIVRIDTSGKVRLTKREQKLLEEVADRLLKIALALTSDQEYREAHSLLKPTITKLHQFLDKEQSPEPALVERLNASYKALELLSRQPLAPELRADISAYLMRQLQTSYFRIYDAQHNALAALMLLMDDLDQPPELLSAIARKVSTGANPSAWACWYFIASHQLQAASAVEPVIDPERKYGIVKHLMLAEQHGATAAAIASFYDDHVITDRQREEWTRWMFDHALTAGDDSLILHWGLALIRMSGDTTVFEQMMSAFNDDSIHNLADRIEESGEMELTGLLYASQSKFPELFDLVQSQGGLHVLGQHLDQLIAWDVDKIQEILQPALIDYASHHAGIRCGDVVRKFFNALRKSALAEQESILRKALNQAFPGRFPIVRSGLEIS